MNLSATAPSTSIIPETLRMDLRFGTRNIRSMYRVGTLKTVSRELSRYRLDLVEVQEVRWEGSGTTPAGEYTFYMERGMRTMNWVWGFCT
jgi:hypothetical protein